MKASRGGFSAAVLTVLAGAGALPAPAGAAEVGLITLCSGGASSRLALSDGEDRITDVVPDGQCKVLTVEPGSFRVSELGAFRVGCHHHSCRPHLHQVVLRSTQRAASTVHQRSVLVGIDPGEHTKISFCFAGHRRHRDVG